MALELMPWVRRLLLIALVLVSGIGFAEEPPEKPAQLPDATSLSAGWWRYFQDAPVEEFEARVEVFQADLETLIAELKEVGEQEDRVRGLLFEVLGLFDSLVDSRAMEPPERMAGGEFAPKRYSVRVLLDLAVSLRELRLEAELVTAEVQEQDAAVRAAKGRIDNAMAAYIELGAAAPDYFLQGLEIIRLRLLWALGADELKRDRAREALLKSAQNALSEQIDLGQKSLNLSKDDEQHWQQQLVGANEALDAIRQGSEKLRLRAATMAADVRGQAQRRKLELSLLDLDIQALSAKLYAAEAELALDVVAAVTGGKPALKVLRAHRSALVELKKSAPKQLEVWRRAIDRERDAAGEKLANTAKKGNLESVHRARVEAADATAQKLSGIRRQLARAELLVDIGNQQIVALGGHVGEITAQAGDTAREVWQSINSLSTRSLFTVNETPVTTLGLIRVSVIVLLAWLISRIVGKGFKRLMARRESMSRASIYLLSRLFHYSILVIGFFIALSSIGIDFTKFALIASAFGVGLGFGLQAIFSNFVAGLIILFERSLKVGDFVELESGLAGEVLAINIRSTLMATNDNVDILVPNSEFVAGRVTNWTLREAFRRIHVPFGVAYGTDKDLVKKAALEAADEVPHTLNVPGRETQVWLIEFGDSSLNFELVVWLKPEAVKRPGSVHAAYCWALDSALKRYDIEIPFPQRDLHLRSAFGRKDEDGLSLLPTSASASAHDPDR